MKSHVFFEIEFIFLIGSSVLLPAGIYAFLLLTKSISRWTVLFLAVTLIALSGADVFLLQTLAEQAKTTTSLFDDKLFSSELSVALYLLPAVFAGIGVNLISHVLTRHLEDAEELFERQQARVKRHAAE
jgi:hypothetical protein